MALEADDLDEATIRTISFKDVTPTTSLHNARLKV
jgi:hypothetical protein